MDLGATLCTRSKPACERCPVAADCKAINEVTDTLGVSKEVAVTLFPGRKPKKSKPLRATTMVIAKHDGRVYLERRPEAGIWGGLWSLPEIGGADVHDWCQETLASGPEDVETWQLLRHSFSHYDLDIQPIVVRVGAPLSKVADCDDATWHRIGDEPPGGMAAPVQQLINTLKTDLYVTNR